MKKVFLAGVIQGSIKDDSINSQDYREKIIKAMNNAHPEVEIFDPFNGHENSIDYDDKKGKETFFGALEVVKSCDLLIAFLPQASLGTAIELWEAYKAGIPVWVISNMKTNWVIRFCAEKTFSDIDSFSEYLQSRATLLTTEN